MYIEKTYVIIFETSDIVNIFVNISTKNREITRATKFL